MYTINGTLFIINIINKVILKARKKILPPDKPAGVIPDLLMKVFPW